VACPDHRLDLDQHADATGLTGPPILIAIADEAIE
jgi:hypothetical protein